MGTIALVHEYRYPASEVWAVASDYDCLAEAVKGLIRFEGLPTGAVKAGQIVRTRVSLFGLLPSFDYTMEVLEADASRMIIRTHEYGGAVKAWDHTLTVEAVDGGCRLRDRVDIDAGAMTWIYERWGVFMYRRRHPARLRMLAQRAGA